MDIKKHLDTIGLDGENAVVVGSGILNALGIRKSADIDLVVGVQAHDRLRLDSRFEKKTNHGQTLLANELMEIGRSWEVLGREWNYEDLLSKSVVIDGVRYITLEFLLEVKKSWLAEGSVRQKDIEDMRLIEIYLI